MVVCSRKKSLLDDGPAPFDNNANGEKKQLYITKESPVDFRQLVSMSSLNTLVLVLYESSSAMPIELIISYYSLVDAPLYQMVYALLYTFYFLAD